MNIALAGFGIEGRESFEYFHNQGGHTITILDERESLPDVPLGAITQLGLGAYDDLSEYDMVVRTAGLNPAKLAGAQFIWSATNEFFKQCPAPIIGVTGTKGKGTTSSFIASILRAAGKTVHLVGNIGVPALQVLPRIAPEDIVVYELSSFQLWDLERSPHVAVVLMIETDHQDVHTDFAQYVDAKANIARYQTRSDICIYNANNQWSDYIGREVATAQTAAYVGDGALVVQRDSELGERYFYYQDRPICPVSVVTLPGAHNLENASAALAATMQVEGVTPAAIAEGLSSFRGLDHRLKYVETKRGVAYYDDSIATTPGSAMAAMKSFPGPKVLILGGSSKGADFSELAMSAADELLRHVLLIGEEAPRIAEQFDQWAPEITYTILERVGMSDVVSAAAAKAEPGDVVILSPACASFGMFRNYQDRGDQFISAVRRLED